VRSSLVLSLVVALAAAGGCKKAETPPPAPPPAQNPAAAAVQVTEVQVGNALGPDKRVRTPMTTFSPKDVIMASVVTQGSAPSIELSARWTYQDGQVVNETRRSVAPTGTVATEFSIQKPDGWPVGAYKVEISLDGRPVQSKAFQVQ
jgi:hypothetical protein